MFIASVNIAVGPQRHPAFYSGTLQPRRHWQPRVDVDSDSGTKLAKVDANTNVFFVPLMCITTRFCRGNTKVDVSSKLRTFVPGDHRVLLRGQPQIIGGVTCGSNRNTVTGYPGRNS
eukprot:2255523-Rhodomonas_salina.2